MREYKFRAWDGEKKEMVFDDFVINSRGVAQREWEDTKDVAQKAYGDIGDYWYLDYTDYYAIQNYHIMQFTGLYDRNGKPIYEGDVLEFKYFDGSISRYTVKYNVGSTKSGFVFFQEWCVFDDLYEIETLGEVIGNIYENPELLDKLSSKDDE